MTYPPRWLADIANGVAAQFRSMEALAPIGCHYFYDESRDTWEITLFVSHTETLGGEFDGKLTSSRFSVDLMELQALFSEVHHFTWQAASLGDDDDLGPHLSLEGCAEGNTIWLRIVSTPPKQFEAGRIADTHDRRFVDRW